MNEETKPSSTLAITSLVLGILSVICFGIVAGIPAIITGHMARGRARQYPDRHANAGLGLAGVILGYVSIVETVVLVFAMLLPMLAALGGAKSKAQEVQCASNLKQIGLAVQMYAQDNKDRFPETLKQMGTYLGTSGALVCPSDAVLKAQSLDAKDFSKTSYVVTLEGASSSNPTQVIVHCSVHHNMLTADGAVQHSQR